MGHELPRQLGGSSCRRRKGALGKSRPLVPQWTTGGTGPGGSHRMGSSEGRISEFLHKAQRRLTSDLIQLQTKTPLVTTHSYRVASSRTPLAQDLEISSVMF